MSYHCKHGFHCIFSGDCDECNTELESLKDVYDNLIEAYDGGHESGAAVAFGIMGMAEAIRTRLIHKADK